MKQVVTKWISVLLAAVLAAAALTACGDGSGSDSSGSAGGSSPSGSQEASDAGGGKQKVEVTIMTWESTEMNNRIMDAMKKFEQDHPDITVKLLPTPINNYGVKVNGMLTAKQAPDLFMTGNDMMLDNGAKGLLYDWSAKASSDSAFMDGFYSGVVDSWHIGDKLFGLPGLLNTYGIFYNKKLFQDAGLAEPKIGWTYDEFFSDMQKLSSSKGGVQQFGYYATPDPFIASLYAASAGGAPFADSITNPTKVEISPQFVEGVEKYKAAIAAGYMNPPNYDLSNVMSSFKESKVPMTFQGQWVADDLIRTAPQDLQWGFVPMPVVQSQAEIYDAVGWCSPATIQNPDAVWEVLKYLVSDMYKEVLPQTPVAPAAYKDAADAYFQTLTKDGHPELGEGINHILQSPKILPIRFLTTWAGKANPFIDATWRNVLSGKADPSELNKMADKINQVIQQAQ